MQKCLTLIILQKEYIKRHNPNRSKIPDHSYRILIIGGSGSGKTKSLLNLLNYQPDIDKFFYMVKIHMKKNISF